MSEKLKPSEITMIRLIDNYHDELRGGYSMFKPTVEFQEASLGKTITTYKRPSLLGFYRWLNAPTEMHENNPFYGNKERPLIPEWFKTGMSALKTYFANHSAVREYWQDSKEDYTFGKASSKELIVSKEALKKYDYKEFGYDDSDVPTTHIIVSGGDPLMLMLTDTLEQFSIPPVEEQDVTSN